MTNPASSEDQPLRSRAEHGSVPAGEHLLPRLPGYEIVRLLAEGGMGVVYEAWQEIPRRRVALKLLRPGLVTPALLRRFGREIELLGRLEHPAIARIYEAGADDLGGISQPFFAMEYVEGMEITRFVRERKLDIRSRLALFKRVVAGVHYAHQKGIIHRDLKPGNVFVDAAGAPKILDFGVARAIEAEDQVGTLTQDKGTLFGTLQYMSPEQAAGQNAEVDIRSDVYSLGVMLYELLAGERPFRLNTTSIPEAVRIVHETEPPRLGTFARALKGDLEIIVATAMAKDKDRRYTSAAALADDPQRYLDSDPILAHAPSAWYRIGKFARRNKALVGAAISIFAALVLGLTFAGIGLMRARQAERKALAQGDLARANLQKALDTVNQFTIHLANGMLESMPGSRPAQEVLLENALFRYQQLANSDLADSQRLEVARTLAVCGETFARWRNFNKAEEALGESARIAQDCCDRHPDNKDHLLMLGDIWEKLRTTRSMAFRNDDAIAAAETTLKIRGDIVRISPDDSRAVHSFANSWNEVGKLYEKALRSNDAISAYENAFHILSELDRKRTDHNPYGITVLARTCIRCGLAHQNAGHANQSADYFAKADDLFLSVLRGISGSKEATDNLSLLETMFRAMKGYPAKEELLREFVPIWEQLSRDDPDKASIQNSLLWIQARLRAIEADSGSAAPSRSAPPMPPMPVPGEQHDRISSAEDKTAQTESPLIIDALDSETLCKQSGQLVSVRGRVRRVDIGSSGNAWVRFSLAPQQFWGVIHRNALSPFVDAYGSSLSGLASRDVELNGFLYNFEGTPQMMLDRPDQVRILDTDRPNEYSPNGSQPPTISAQDIDALKAHEGPVVVEGKIHHVSPNPQFIFLRFDSSERNRFTAVIPTNCVAPIEKSLGGTPEYVLSNRTVRVYGFIYLYRGKPCIEIRTPDQIEILGPQ